MSSVNITNRKLKKALAAFTLNSDFVTAFVGNLSDLTPAAMSGSSYVDLKNATQDALIELETDLAALKSAVDAVA